MNTDYQSRVASWLSKCFGELIASDRRERAHRFLEEALELAQAASCTEEEAALLLSYVFGRPQGSVEGEIGGVLVTLAGLSQAYGVDMAGAGERELERNQNRTAEIRAKRAKKVSSSPLP